MTENVGWNAATLKKIGNFRKLAIDAPIPGSTNYITRNAYYLAHHDADLATYNGYLNGTLGVGGSRGEKQANDAYSNMDGNGNEASGDGYKYRGRGLFQITRKGGYERLANGGTRGNNGHDPILGLNQILGANYDFVAQSVMIASDPTIAALSAAWYWRYGSSWGDLNNIINNGSHTDLNNFKDAHSGIQGNPPLAERLHRELLWDGTNNIIYDQNAYGNMSEVLKALGITASNKKDYNTQFGITLNKPNIQVILPATPSLLTAYDGGVATTTSTQTLLPELQADFDIQPGEVDMLIMDMPNVPPQAAPVLMQIATVAQKTPSKPDPESLYGVMGVCVVSPTLAKMGMGSNSSLTNGLSLYPQGTALRRIPEASDDVALQMAAKEASVQILQQPKHGVIVSKDGDFNYVPNEGYVGNDKVVFLVNIDGRNVKTVYYIKVVDATLTSRSFDELYKKYCPAETDWRISFNTIEANSIVSTLTEGVLNFV